MRVLNWLRTVAVTGLALFGSVTPGLAQEAFEERGDWKSVFEKHGVAGTLVVADERDTTPKLWVYQKERAAKRSIPASTFKIAHALFALDAEVVRDEFQVFPWDGVKRTFPGHNQDQDLRSSMRVSAVWLYEEFARSIGKDRARSYLERTGYGNADPGGESDTYWLDGNLRISAFEQIEFLRKLYRNTLPFRVEHQRLVKDVMVNEAQRDWILRAKTGWTGQQGWWVGWVEWPRGPVFFALHIDTPRRED
ncbi:MAG: class D beta-lactamase, partial [Bryobacterales bacterium]|nr:class D beta-lactamase [Bryobacterales bacterium]